MKSQKIVIFTLFVLLNATNILLAQNQIEIGIKGGLSIPNLTSGNSNNPINSGYSSRLGGDFAVQYEYYLSKRFSIQPQLEYSQQGGKKNGNQAFSVPAEMQMQFPTDAVPQYLYANYNSVAKINYLMLPILAKYHLNLGSKWQLYAGVGPFVSTVLSAKNISTGSSNIYLDSRQTQQISPVAQSFERNEDIKSELRSFNAGISGLLGLSYKLPTGAIFIEGGGNYGLVDIQKNGTNGNNKTGAAIINIGYLIRIKSLK
jgi:hypothetical protein